MIISKCASGWVKTKQTVACLEVMVYTYYFSTVEAEARR